MRDSVIKIIVIAIAAFLVVTISFIYWRSTRPARKYAPVKRRAAEAVKKKELALPSIAKKVANPKVAVIVDDFGYNENNLESLFAIKKPVTLSVLPNLPYSGRIASLARAKGYEVILHLPLEPHRKDVREEVDTIRSGMSGAEVVAKLEDELKSTSGASGVSNHMGSKSTEEKDLMRIIMGELKRRGLYFFDSLTSQKSVCQEAARALGVRFAKRDVFLDLPNDTEHIRRQVLEMRRIAFRKGRAIAVCHDRSNTVKVLAEMMPALSADGIRFVYLSDLVN